MIAILFGKLKFTVDLLLHGSPRPVKYLHKRFNHKFTTLDAVRTTQYGHLDCLIYILNHLKNEDRMYFLYTGALQVTEGSDGIFDPLSPLTAIEYNQFHIFSYLLKQNYEYNLFQLVHTINNLQEEPNGPRAPVLILMI